MPRTWFDNFGLILDLSVRHIGMSPAESILSATTEMPRTPSGWTIVECWLPVASRTCACFEEIRSSIPRAFYGSMLTMVGGKVLWKAREAEA